ncbi:MAG TPA: cupin domain-containing protein [Bryobacteraceae bacterium]|nr:cupin domain-containing protein [Bryobacteraceae bacterium]
MNTPAENSTHSEAFFEKLTIFAFGILEEPDAVLIEQHLAGCETCQKELASLLEVLTQLPAALPDVTPPPSVRAKVLDAIGVPVTGAAEQPLPGIYVIREPEQRWRKSRYAGVSYKLLHVDEATNNVTTILKLDPGATYPAHRHAGVEQCLVLQGTVRIGQILLGQGDFEFAKAGTEHAPIVSDQGCQLLIISNQRDEVFA